MSEAVSPGVGGPTPASAGTGVLERDVGDFWWLWIVTGIAWTIAALVILQFDSASITTIAIIVGCMFISSGMQQLVLAAMGAPLAWLWAIFGALFLIAGVVCFVNPTDTFAGLADMLGFLFLLFGVWWTIQAFLEREGNPLWWVQLLSGVLMTILAFWTSGQFFIQKAYVLLVFAGIWALMHGITDIVRAFRVRGLRSTP
jgi:uncharacterized membrane protein HdeD (DUF308 family)